MPHRNNKHLKQLAIADPDLAGEVQSILAQKTSPASDRDIALLVDETLWALSEEISFGREVALGYAGLSGEADAQMIARYRDLVREFGRKGPTMGRIMATHLVPVCKYGDNRLLKHFLHTLDVMQSKGSYTLKDPLEALSELLNSQDRESASAYLQLLADTFAGELSYVQCQHFAHILPRAVLGFAPLRRIWQMEQLRRVVKTDVRLTDSLLDGLEKGLHLLSKDSLNRFVALGLDKLKRSRKSAAKFLSLESKLGADTFAQMQVVVPFSHVQAQLNRYVRARTGLAISVRPLSDLPEALLKADRQRALACSDGKFIYLPAEISTFPDKEENINLFKCLTRLEAGLYECNTFDFDLEKALERCQSIVDCGLRIADLNALNIAPDFVQNLKSKIQNQKNLSDLERFFDLFPIPELAADLFTVFEHGRLKIMLGKLYPGLIRQTLPLLCREAMRMLNTATPVGLVTLLYLWIALEIDVQKKLDVEKVLIDHAAKISARFEEAIAVDDTVETCAEMVAAGYKDVERLLQQTAPDKRLKECYESMLTPFGRRLRPDLFFSTYRHFEKIAVKLKAQLKDKELRVYKSDIRRHLIAANGSISREDLQAMILSPKKDQEAGAQHVQQTVDLSWLDLSKIFGPRDPVSVVGDDVTGPVFWYPEWDCGLQDYLAAHVRVLDRNLPMVEGDFYCNTLTKHAGLIKIIRYAFELLKPEGLVRLRQWVEGDEFDYRALLDFAMDKKAGRIPSDRLYIKRIKQVRDVAVLLLVDLSRSTANTVNGSQATVLDVEKEAIVLFCEALEVVGDAFAIAGFSGTGRLGVDYFRVKGFDETMNDTIKQRINAVAPQRSTRMGGAIRHATCQLEKMAAKVRLLIILGDGFPNDVDYKRDYAILDTGKAIFEAHSKDIYTHAITVNMASDPKLDDLFGNVRHNVISDVRELPDKLLRIYGELTRH